MELWFKERQTPGLEIGFKVKETLLRGRSPFQEIAVVETFQYGRLLALDGMVMTTEADEFIYHEMIVHPAMCTHPRPRRILVVGGGDGGAIREVLRYPTVEKAVLCEIDREVVEASKRFFPTISSGLDHSLVTVVYEDGMTFIKGKEGEFDVLIVDSPDPVGPAESLYQAGFYAECHQALGPEGILVVQSESPLLHQELVASIRRNLLEAGFREALFHWAVVPTDPGAMWCWALATKGPHPLNDFNSERCRSIQPSLKYYNEAVHRGAFALPNFFKNKITG